MQYKWNLGPVMFDVFSLGCKMLCRYCARDTCFMQSIMSNMVALHNSIDKNGPFLEEVWQLKQLYQNIFTHYKFNLTSRYHSSPPKMRPSFLQKCNTHTCQIYHTHSTNMLNVSNNIKAVLFRLFSTVVSPTYFNRSTRMNTLSCTSIKP